AIDGTEELALAHAEVLLNRRKDSSGIPRYPIGAGVPLSVDSEYAREGVKANFDLLCLNTPWRLLEPEKDEHRWEQMDDWAEWAARVRMPVIAGPLIN